LSQNFIGYGNSKQSENHYSYIQIEGGKITAIEEKQKISENYCCGIYGFKSAEIFITYAERVIQENLRINNQFFFSQVYKLMLDEHDIIPIFISYTKLIGNSNHLFHKPLRICFDLDNTLVTLPTIPGDYSSVKPIFKMISLLKNLKKLGHTIIIYTARRMNTHKHNVGRVIRDIGLVTFQTLEKFNIEYDEIIFGKPVADIYIDDKAINDKEYLKEEGSDFISKRVDGKKIYTEDYSSIKEKIEEQENKKSMIHLIKNTIINLYKKIMKLKCYKI
jgi:capsule biosynthesis phosphatase